MGFTDSQMLAIQTKENNDILVSAAAGSGKTTVLCERIVRAIVDDDSPLDISRALVVTFTRSAAHDLRRKLREKLIEAGKRSPDDVRIRKAIARLPGARISTIHSFCYELVRSNFASLDLSPAVRIADETQIASLEQKLMNEAIARAESEKNEKSARLFDALSGNIDDNLVKSLCDLYDRLSSDIDGIGVLKAAADEFAGTKNDDFYKTVWGKTIIAYEKEVFLRLDAIYEQALRIIAENPVIGAARGEHIASQKELIGTILHCIEQSPQKCASLVSAFEAEKLHGYPKHYEDSFERKWIEILRRDFPKKTQTLTELLSFSDAEVSAGASALEDNCRVLFDIFCDFEEKYKNEKKRLGIISFSDLEKYCSALLYNEDKTPSPLARELSESFDAIFIDEYQDTNELQDSIFRAISHGDRFMVGDIKQSIYGFRGARPELFASYRESFSDLEKEQGAKDAGKGAKAGTKIFLRENFRSGERIIDFANAVCSPLFRLCSSIPYSADDDLRFASLAPDAKEPVRIAIFDSNAKQTEDEYFVSSIKDMIKNEGISPSDISVLVRKNEVCTRVSELLRAAGIPYSVKKGGDFFDRPEILLINCILNSIDNPTRDIFLAGAMRSALFGFSIDELTSIRSRHSDARSLYSALLADREQDGEGEIKEKELRFLSFLDEYRRAERTLTPDELIWRFYCEYSFIALCSSSGKSSEESDEIKSALMYYYDMARSSKASSGEGTLSAFLRGIARLIKSGDRKIASNSKNAVRIMTVHDSKGLESPVVWMYGADRGTEKTKAGTLCFDKTLGLSMKVLSRDGYSRVVCPQTKAAVFARELCDIDEECRVLYVALTRAKRRLIISGRAGKNADDLLHRIRINSCRLSRMTLLSEGKNYLNWILLALEAFSPDESSYTIIRNPEFSSNEDDSIEAEENIESKSSDENADVACDDFDALIRERFGYEYPFARSTKIPAKLSVSHLYPGIFDENAISNHQNEEESGGAPSLRAPKFTLPERLRATGAERGSATHAFMQFCDFEKVERDGVETHLSSLVEDGFIAASDAKIVDIAALKTFFDSDLYKKMRRAHKIMRERRFLITLPASDFTSDQSEALTGESVLVQGVVDCFFTEEDTGEIWLVDYKTDRVNAKMSREENANILRERHKTQLHYYRVALERILGKKITHTVLYSFALGGTVEVE